jgi:WD40 repeat protein
MSRHLPAALMDRVLTRYPLPVADAVLALASADNAHEERDRVIEVFRAVLRYLAALALAARGQLGPDGEGEEARELLGALGRRGLSDGQWAGLLRELVRPWSAAPERAPLPGLVRLVRGRFARVVDELLEMRKTGTVAHGGTGDDAAIEALLTRRMPCLAELLELAEGAWGEARLVAPLPPGAGAQRAWLLAGGTPPRGRWRRVSLAEGVALPAGELALIDAQGRPLLVLGPVLLLRKSEGEGPEEVFVIDGVGRRGAVYVALPSMNERVEPAAGEALSALLAGTRREEPESEASRPYRGLESFGPEHAAVFFGREELAESLALRVRRSPMVTVTGPSGSGKSSLLRAGVAPRLEGFAVAELRPGVDPCAALARALARTVAEDGDAGQIEGVLRRRPEATGTALARWCASRERSLLVLVDQAEEVFTLCRDPVLRAAFARALASCGGAVRVVLVVREDFFARLATLDPLRGVYSQSVEVVTTPGREALERTLTQPARRLGYRFEPPSLVERMISAAEGEEAALGLLQFCADRLWEARDRRRRCITEASYEALGGVEGALAAHAERTMASLTPAQRAVARSLLRRLVTAEGTRALASRAELLSSSPAPEDTQAVLERMVEARLVVAREAGGRGGEASLELVHEALLLHWQRLRGWLDADREGQRRLDATRRAAREWDARGRPRGLLWRDEVLAEVRAWRRGAGVELSELEAAFLDASEAVETRASRIGRGAVAAAVAVLGLFVVILGRQYELAVVARRQAEAARGDAERAGEQARAALGQSEVGRLTAEAARREVLGQPGEAGALLRAARSLAPGARLDAAISRLDSLGEAPRVLRAAPDAVLALAFVPRSGAVAAASGSSVRVWGRDGARLADLDHQGTVWALAASPDGDLLATASADRSVSLWDPATGQRRARVELDASVQPLVFSPDGRLIAAGTTGGEIRLLRASGELLHAWPAHRAAVASLAFSPDGRWLASGGRDRTASLWPLPGPEAASWSGAAPRDLGAFDAPIRQVAFAPGGDQVAVLFEKTVRLIPLEKGPTVRLDGHEHLVYALAFSPDGRLLATASSDRTVKLWSLPSGREMHTLTGHERAVYRLAFSPDGRLLATASLDGTLRLWEPRAGVLLRTLRGHRAGVSSLAFSPDGLTLASGDRSDEGRVRLWSVDAGVHSLQLRGHRDDVQGVLFSPDGSLLATTSHDRTARLWNPRTGEPLSVLVHQGQVYGAAFSPDGSRLATASHDRTARIWESVSGHLLHTLSGHEGYLPALAFSPDGRLLATASVDRRARLWDPSSGALLRSLAGHDGALFGLAFAHDGRRLASLADDGRALFWPLARPDPPLGLPAPSGLAEAVASRPGLLAFGTTEGGAILWDVDQAAVQARFLGHEGAVLSVAISPDGRLLATGSADQTAALWDARTGARLATLAGHDGGVLALAFAPGGRLLATGSADKTIRIWSYSGAFLGALGGHEDKITSLQFSPDGSLLASASQDDTARLWSLGGPGPGGLGEPGEPGKPEAPLGAASNLRVCRSSFEVVPVEPFPAVEAAWAPGGACPLFRPLVIKHVD